MKHYKSCKKAAKSLMDLVPYKGKHTEVCILDMGGHRSGIMRYKGQPIAYFTISFDCLLVIGNSNEKPTRGAINRLRELPGVNIQIKRGKIFLNQKIWDFSSAKINTGGHYAYIPMATTDYVAMKAKWMKYILELSSTIDATEEATEEE
jgi:hypothetical protein